jgi:hypothetical protein
MSKQATLLALLFCALMPLVVNAQSAPNYARPPHPNETFAPKVVFVGDYITAQWASVFAANPNWINQGDPNSIVENNNGIHNVLANFQANVVSLHPAAVHIMVGLSDAETDDATYSGATAYFLSGLNEVVLQAKAANIKVILGIEPYSLQLHQRCATLRRD